LNNINYYKNKNVGILGLGLSGTATARVLVNSNANIFVFDDKKDISYTPSKTTWLNYKKWPWEKINTLVVSPGIPINSVRQHEAIRLAKKYNINIINDIDLFYQTKPKATIIGITGTNGKSTTVALLDHILKFNKINSVIGGNYGFPACEIIDPGKGGVIILELSSYQLDGVSQLTLNAAAIINITPDHLDYHEYFDAYKNSKLKILNFLNKGSLFVLDEANPYIKDITEKKEIKQVTLLKVNTLSGKKTVNANIYLSGKHNFINTAIAAALAKNIGLVDKQIKLAVNNFKGLPHRLEPIYESKKIKIINDSKATNGEAAAAALTAFKNIYWIAGGEAKKDGIGKALECLKNVLEIFLIGQSSKVFLKQILDSKKNISVMDCSTLENATKIAIEKAQKSKLQNIVILLSPAAASFDQFKNFEARGNEFKNIINVNFKEGNLIC